MPRKTGVFYGYWIIAVSFVCLFVMSGCGFYSFGLFVRPLEADFGWSRTSIMVANTVAVAVRGISSVIIGRLVDRYNPKWMLVIGAIIAGGGLILTGTMNQLWQFWVFYGFSGFGFASIGFLPITAILFKWFKKYRGRAIGLSGIGIGIGGFVVAPVIGSYIIPTFGWRAAFYIMGAFTMISVIPLALLIIKRQPEDMGLLPDGIKATPGSAGSTAKSPAAKESGLNLHQAMRTRAFWLTVVSCAAFGFPIIAIIQNQVAHLEDIGFPIVVAAGALGVVGLANAGGKLVFGTVSDMIKPKYALTIGLGIQFIALLILLSINPATPVVIVWIYALLIGLGLGSWLPTMSMLVSSTFGMVAYGTIFGMIHMINTLGSSLGPLFAGYVFDNQGSYRTAFIVFLVLYAIAITATLLIRRPVIKTSGEN